MPELSEIPPPSNQAPEPIASHIQSLEGVFPAKPALAIFAEKKGKFTAEHAAAARARKLELLAEHKQALLNKPPSDEEETFESIQLQTTRARIVATYAALEKEKDWDLAFKLGCLLKKLWEIEQLLSNRPGPGTRKPKPERSERASAGISVDDMP